MNNCDEAIQQILNGKSEAYICCGKLKNAQESLRVQTFNCRKKLPKLFQDLIGIAKAEENGILYIRVYKREDAELFERDPISGNLVPMATVSPKQKELERIVSMMKQDGLPQEEIDAYIVDWNEQNV